jgi:hypothetical protein
LFFNLVMGEEIEYRGIIIEVQHIPDHASSCMPLRSQGEPDQNISEEHHLGLQQKYKACL